MTYDPDSYWQSRGGEAYRQYTEGAAYAVYRQAQDEFFGRLIKDLRPRSLLDFACGSGKLFPHWRDVPEVDAYDRALSQIEVARKEAARVRPENPYRVMHCVTDSRTELPYDNAQFDLVIAAEVLLHVLPGDLQSLLAELRRVCGGALAIVTAAPFENPAPHCFNHDYTRAIDGLFDIIEDHERHRQRYIVARPCRQEANTGHPRTAEGRLENAVLAP